MLLRFSPLFSTDGQLPAIIQLAPAGVVTELQPIRDGQPLSAAFPAGVENTGNYRTDPPATIQAALREARVAGGGWSTALGQTPVAGTLIAIRTRVTTSAGAVRFFPSESGSAGFVLVADLLSPAPFAAAQLELIEEPVAPLLAPGPFAAGQLELLQAPPATLTPAAFAASQLELLEA